MAQKTAATASMKRQRDEVVDNAIFRESVRKEQKHAYLNENFDFNPKNLIAITDKPTKKFEMGETKAEDDELRLKLNTLA